MPSPGHDVPRSFDGGRWPPLLLELRRAARPDRARVGAYLSLTRRPAGWDAYTEFLTVHRAWIAALHERLSQAGISPRGPLPDAAGLEADSAAAAPDAVDVPVPRDHAHALGYLYVFEAFRLGCSVLARRIRGRADPSLEAAAAGATSRAWDDLVMALRGVAPEDRPAVVEGARDCFSAWERRLATTLAGLGIDVRGGEANAA